MFRVPRVNLYVYILNYFFSFVVQTGMLSALPWFCMTVMIAICGYVSDKLRKHLSVGTIRKLFFNAGMLLS